MGSVACYRRTASRRRTVVPVRHGEGLHLLGALSNELGISIDKALELLQAFPLLSGFEALGELAQTLRNV